MCLGAVLMLSRAILLLGLPWVFELVWSGSELAWGRLGRVLGGSALVLGHLGGAWATLTNLESILMRILAILDASWGCLDVVSGYLGSFLG